MSEFQDAFSSVWQEQVTNFKESSFVQELNNVLNWLMNAPAQEILGTVLWALVLLAFAFFINKKLDEKFYEKAKKRFEQENKQYKDQYFTFAEWLKIADKEQNDLFEIAYAQKFGDDTNIVNTDSLEYTMKSLKGKVKISRVIILLTILLTVIGAGAYIFYISDPETSKKVWEGMQEVNQRENQH